MRHGVVLLTLVLPTLCVSGCASMLEAPDLSLSLRVHSFTRDRASSAQRQREYAGFANLVFRARQELPARVERAESLVSRAPIACTVSDVCAWELAHRSLAVAQWSAGWSAP